MSISEELAELKYQEILEYQEVVTTAAINTSAINAADAQIACLGTAVLTSLLMYGCTIVFMPSSNRKNQR